MLLETQSERCNRFLIQVNKAIDIFNSKYPDKQALFIFDNAPSHRKRSDDSLNVGPGGKQPVMKDTVVR